MSDSSTGGGGMPVRVRFTLSWRPILHIGLARTALLASLIAKAHNGEVVVRLDNAHDSHELPDLSPIVDGLTWLNIQWDEGLGRPGERGPYETSGRMPIYRHYASALWEAGHAYVCDCEPAALLDGSAPDGEGYDGRCRDRRLPLGSGALRFRVATRGVTRIADAVAGELRLSNAGLTDPVIVRSNGAPTLYLTNAVDDMGLNVQYTLWDRTARMTQLFVQIAERLQIKPPTLIHIGRVMSLLPSEAGKKLSSPALMSSLGVDAADVASYRAAGYSAEAIVSLLLRTLCRGPYVGHPERLKDILPRFSWDLVNNQPIQLPLAELAAIERYWRRKQRKEADRPGDSGEGAETR